MNNFDSENFFDDFVSDLTAANLQSMGQMSIIEFANRIIFNNDPDFQLYPTQKAILKSFYNEPLTEEETSILNGWVDEDRSTWIKNRKYISLVLEAGRRASKCWVRDDVLTLTDKGLYYIEEIAKENAIDTSITGWTPLKQKMSAIQEIGKEQEITDIYVENKVKTKRIITREGYAFEATSDHKIKVLEPNGLINWKEFQYINSNDYIVISKNNTYNVENYYEIPDHPKYKIAYDSIRPFDTPKFVDPNLGYFMGVLCGDGTWNSPSCHIASHEDDEPYLKEKFTSLFGHYSYLSKYQKSSGKCKIIKVGNCNLKKIIKSLGYELTNNKEKQVPWVIRRSPKSVIAAFLSGLFDTDGTVVKEGRSIEFCAKDYTLIREVQQLLLLFGIIANIKQYYNNKFKTFHWKLRINGLEGRQIFAKEVGFKLPRKQNKIINDLNIKESSKEGGHLLTIPYQQNILYNYKQSLDIPTDNYAVKNKDSNAMYSNFLGSLKSDKAYRTEFRNIAGNCCKKNNKENITYPKLIKLINWAEEKSLLPEMIKNYEYIISNNFFFSKVETLEDKENDVGDINVSTTHKYLANGCISHNCNSESAEIITTEGNITYGELHQKLSNNEKVGIYTYDIKSNITEGYITYDIKTELNAIEQTYKITTETGKTEIVNENHPFLTCKKESWYPTWVELKNLNKGNYIATSGEVPVFGPLVKSEEELKLWSLALTTFKFQHNKTKLKEHQDFLKQYFTFSNFKELQQQLKIYRKTIKKEDITSLNKECTILFLKHLLENNIRRQCRNTVNTIFLNGKPHFFEVSIEVHKYRKQIASQFLKLGICTYLIQDSQGIKGLAIQNTSTAEKLISIFGWNIYKGSYELKKTFNNKNSSLSKVGNSKRDKFNLNRYTIENQYPLTELPTNKFLSTYYNNKLHIGKKHIIAQEALKINDVKLYDWATNNINWEKIVSIEPYKVEQTIALEVKDTHIIGNAIISHNSTMASIIALKEFYDLIILDNPQKKYGILNASPITILVMAQSQAQVKETIFAAMKGYAENSRFFTALQNKGEIEILSEEIRCKSKNIAIYAKHTNSKSLVGYTVKAMILDEVSRFETVGEDGKNKAFEIWDNVGAGGSTFGSDFKKVAISSAWEPGDPIEVLYNLALKNPSSLAFKLTTFQVNLSLKKGITEVVKSDYLNNFIKARREYEGIRFTKFNTFIEIENLNKASRSVSVIDAIPSQIDTDTPGGPKHYAGLEIQRITPNQISDSLSFIHVDPALKKDSAALAIARPIQEGGKWKIQIDALLKWEPHTDNKGNKRVVSFIDIEEKLIQISKIRRTGKITFDQWQCLEENSLIKIPNGLMRVKECSIGSQVLSRNNIINNVINIKRKKNVPCIKITTKNGYELTGTYNHPILNKNKTFVELQDLSLNDSILISIPKIESFEIDNKLATNAQEHEALLLGYLIAEGNWETKTVVEFTNTETEVINDYIQSFKYVTSKTPNVYSYKNLNENYKNKVSVKIGCKDYHNRLTQELNLKSGSKNKKLPNYIFTASKKEIGLMLSSMYEGDGNITCFKPPANYKKSSPRIYVEYNTISEQLSLDLQSILLYLGIKSNRKKLIKKTPAGNITYLYRVLIYGQNLIKFKNYIDFRSTRKKQLLLEAINNLSFSRKSRVNSSIEKIVNIEFIEKTIMHMEVSGDHTYQSEFINHNSESIIQKLNSLGIDAQQVSCSREMQFTYYTLFRDLLAHDYIVLPRDNAWTDNAITELSELVLKANRQIIHPTAGKDLADAIVNAVYQCNQYMIKSGFNLSTGLNTGIIQSQGLEPLRKITVSKFSTNNIKIGSAIDKLYKKKF